MLVLICSIVKDASDRIFMCKLYAKYEGYIFGTAYNILGDAEPCDDIRQDVVIKLIKKLPKLRTMREEELAVYINRTTRSTVYDYLRKKKRLPFASEFDDEEPALSSADDRILAVSDTDSFARSLNALNERDKELLYRKYYLDETDRELATRFNLKEDSVRVYVKRARDRLKKKIDAQAVGGGL